jgi:hypothetical protein
VVAAIGLDARAERFERVDVGVEPPAPDDVAAGRRHVGLTETREERPG